MGWNVDGIVESRLLDLHYNEPSETLVGHFQRDLGHRSVESIYTRRRDDTQYRRAFGRDDTASARTVVCVSKAPIALFNVYVVRDEEPGAGSDWSHIGRIDLSTGAMTVALDKQSFCAKHGRAWVSTLFSASEDGATVLCSIPSERPDPAEEGAVLYDYFLCRLDLATGEFERITLLRKHFF